MAGNVFGQAPTESPLRRAPLLLLPILLGLGACAALSEIAPLGPDTYGLTAQSASPATAARIGVATAQRFCAERGRDFEAVRTEIGVTDYRIAFRCPGRVPDFLTPPDVGIDTPGFRPGPMF